MLSQSDLTLLERFALFFGILTGHHPYQELERGTVTGISLLKTLFGAIKKETQSDPFLGGRPGKPRWGRGVLPVSTAAGEGLRRRRNSARRRRHQAQFEAQERQETCERKI